MPQSGDRADKSIPSDAVLWRLISPEFQKPDELGGIRVTTQAFQNRPESLATSFVLADAVHESGRVAGDLVADKPGYGVVAISVGDIRDMKLEVIRDPQPDEPGHVLVPGKKTRSIKRRLKEAARWVVQPTPRR